MKMDDRSDHIEKWPIQKFAFVKKACKDIKYKIREVALSYFFRKPPNPHLFLAHFRFEGPPKAKKPQDFVDKKILRPALQEPSW